ncbi:sialate O-acetylesterase, partial [Granulicella sp. dw_53]|uniref:sialate O-acetylesterase n=1 Tax=Granulicella sp. dw_53 TaxID=2719792 RepID=UPI0021067ABF
MPHLLSDHAVLQRDAPVHLWGWSAPDVRLTLHFHAQTVTAVANGLGQWDAYLMPEKAGGPYTLTIDGDGHTERQDLLVGDIWFASGQSNMEMPLNGFPPTATVKDAAKEIASAHHPKLRLLLEEHVSSDVPQDDVNGAWTECTPETAAKFSAVAYFFGREISEKEDVPVGLIDASWGGTPADSWVSLDTLGSDPQLLPAFQARAEFAAKQSSLVAQVAQEKREDDAARAAGKPLPSHMWHPSEVSWSPAGLYNGMIAPAVPYTVRGFLWYQGETNSGPSRAPYYVTLFPALIRDWRMHFGQGDLPFLFVQISSFHSPAENWGAIRDAQRRTLWVRNTAMAVSLDVGLEDNVHPPDKQTVAARLALAARAIVYGEHVAYASPLLREVTSEPNALRVWFDNAEGLSTHGKPLQGFEIAG